MMENNFGRGAYLTFLESFYTKIYRIENDSLKLSYTVKFPGLEIPSDVYDLQPLEVVEYLRQFNYATIRSYLENKKYIYLMIIENKSNEKPTVYHWIINKYNDHEVIIKMNMIIDSYFVVSTITDGR
jgi:hypothetical protein